MTSNIFFKKKVWKKYIALVVLIYGLALGFVFTFQRSFLYFPNDSYLTPKEAGKEHLFEELDVTTEDGINLKGWYSPSTTKKQTLVLFHGNADSIRKLSFVADTYRQAGYGFLVTEYRGFSDFEGKPTEQGIYADARAFVKALLAKGIDPKNLILFGHSLGTGVATQMALEFKESGGLMLLAPFLSIPDMAQKRFPIFPVRYMVWDKFANNEKLPQLYMPLLIVHGDGDIVIPFSQGKALFDLANDPKEFHRVPEGGHNSLFIVPFAEISLAWLGKLNPIVKASGRYRSSPNATIPAPIL